MYPLVQASQNILADYENNRWVFNTALPVENKQSSRAIYDPTKSPTYKAVRGATFGVNYGDGSQTYGLVGTDTVEVGGITVGNQPIELPNVVSSSFTNDTNSDGILGMAFQAANTIKPTSQPSFIENAIPSLQAPVFTANLKAGSVGSYQFGFVDNTAYSGALHYTPLVNSPSAVGLWAFATNPGASVGIADTGSSLLLLDNEIVGKYWAPVPGHTSDAQGITFPCGTHLPDFHIELGGYTATIPGKLINYAPATDQPGCEYTSSPLLLIDVYCFKISGY